MRRSWLPPVALLFATSIFVPTWALGQRARPPQGPTLGGFLLGEGFATAALRCQERYRFERDPQGTAGTCYGAPRPIGYPIASVFLRDCDRHLCQITVRVRVEGEVQLAEALNDISQAWDARYGDHDDAHRVTIPGAAANECVSALGGGQYACLLRGTAMFVRDWTGRSGDLASGQRAQLVAQGSEGSRVVTLRMTLATASGVAESRERDL
ncbi:MAG: hypothetical protein ACK6CU_15405 [Deltaproteobacteria bacterium]|jgi:hypothetical protein